MTSSLLPSFPFLEKPRPGEPPSPPAAQQPEETDSPQSPLPDEEGEVDIQPHRQKMLVQFPFQKRKAAGPQGTPSKESTGRFGVSSDKEDDSVITVSDDGSDPNGASTSTGQTVPTSRRKRSREGGEAATLMDRHNNWVWELVRNPDLGLSDVYSRVLVGLLARQPIEADLFPGILEGLAGNLGLSPAGTFNPPRSRQEGMMRR